MAVPYNQDRPALFEELRFAKRQQWYVAASSVALNAAVIAATRDFKKLHWVAALRRSRLGAAGFKCTSARTAMKLRGGV